MWLVSQRDSPQLRCCRLLLLRVLLKPAPQCMLLLLLPLALTVASSEARSTSRQRIVCIPIRAPVPERVVAPRAAEALGVGAEEDEGAGEPVSYTHLTLPTKA